MFVSGMAHFFMSVGGSKFHERLAHFFVDIYTSGAGRGNENSRCGIGSCNGCLEIL